MLIGSLRREHNNLIFESSEIQFINEKKIESGGLIPNNWKAEDFIRRISRRCSKFGHTNTLSV